MKQVFTPDQLRLKGQLAWMKDGDERSWFSAPSSDRQIVFSDTGEFVHALTGVEIEILLINEHCGSPEIMNWHFYANFYERPLFADLVETSEDIYGTLRTSDYPFWATDPDEVREWCSEKTLFARYRGDLELFEVITRDQVRAELDEEVLKSKLQRKKERLAGADELAARREQRERETKARDAWRSTDEYRYALCEILVADESDFDAIPKEIFYKANSIAEWRLRLGRWADNDIHLTEADAPFQTLISQSEADEIDECVSGTSDLQQQERTSD